MVGLELCTSGNFETEGCFSRLEQLELHTFTPLLFTQWQVHLELLEEAIVAAGESSLRFRWMWGRLLHDLLHYLRGGSIVSGLLGLLLS
jgi:hypothetical protein